MTGSKVYLIGHRETQPTWKTRELDYTPEPALADYYKIGIARNPKRRRQQLSVGTPHKLELVTTIQTSDAKEVEHLLHRLYWFEHQRSEWYKLTSNAVNSLKGLDRLEPEVLREVSHRSNWVGESTLYIEVQRAR